jgi:hypothetical protein
LFPLRTAKTLERRRKPSHGLGSVAGLFVNLRKLERDHRVVRALK